MAVPATREEAGGGKLVPSTQAGNNRLLASRLSRLAGLCLAASACACGATQCEERPDAHQPLPAPSPPGMVPSSSSPGHPPAPAAQTGGGHRAPAGPTLCRDRPRTQQSLHQHTWSPKDTWLRPGKRCCCCWRRHQELLGRCQQAVLCRPASASAFCAAAVVALLLVLLLVQLLPHHQHHGLAAAWCGAVVSPCRPPTALQPLPLLCCRSLQRVLLAAAAWCCCPLRQ